MNKFIKFFDDYSLMVYGAKYKGTKGTGLKILPPKQMLQKIPIAHAPVKAGNSSEKFLYETKKIVILWISQKKLLTKYKIT